MRRTTRRFALSLALAVVATPVLESSVTSPPTDSSAAAAQTPRSAAFARCTEPFPTSSAQWQRVLDGTTAEGRAFAADGAISLKFDRRTVVWVWGDMWNGRRAGEGLRIDGPVLGSSQTVQIDGCMHSVGSGELAPAGFGRALWPMSGAVVDRTGIVFLSEITRGPGAMSFEQSGTRVLVGRYKPGRGLVPVTTATLASGLNGHSTSWGSAVASRGRWLYIWGTRLPVGSFGREVRLARVPTADVTRRSAWQYWTGRGWSDAESDSAVLIPASRGTDADMTAQIVGQKVRIVSKFEGPFGSEVHVWSGPITGPYRRQRVATVGGLENGAATYAARLHPGLVSDGQQLVTVNRNLTEPAEDSERIALIAEDRSRYLPAVVAAGNLVPL